MDAECDLGETGPEDGPSRERGMSTLAILSGSFNVMACLALPYRMVPRKTPEHSPVARICEGQHRIVTSDCGVSLTKATSIIQSSAPMPALCLRAMNRRITARIANERQTKRDTMTSGALFSLM